METHNLETRKKELIEKIGVFYERWGMQPVPARIIGLLLVTDKPYLTFNEITTELSVSKSAVSIAVNLLMNTKQIEYITLPGDRKRYFKSRINNWRDMVGSVLDFAKSYSSLFNEILEIRSDKDSEVNRSLNEIILFIEYIEEALPHLISNWEERQG